MIAAPLPSLSRTKSRAAVSVAFFAAENVKGRMLQTQLACFVFGKIDSNFVAVVPGIARSYLPSFAPMYLKPVNVSTQRNP